MAFIEPRGTDTAEEYSLAVWNAAGQVAEENVLNLVRLWAWSPYAQKDHQRLGQYLHGRTTVARQAKETMIIRACTRSFGSYELFHHVPIAIASGLSEEQVRAMQAFDAQYSDVLTDREKACIQYSDELSSGRGVCDRTWSRLCVFFSDLEILELSLQNEYWSANARFTRTCDAPQEPWARRSRDDMIAGRLSPTAENVVSREPSPTVAADARIELVDVDAATTRNAKWFERWQERFGAIPSLVRAWALNEHIQVAYQSAWETVLGGGLRLSPARTLLAGSFVAWRNHSDHVAAVVWQTCSAIPDTRLQQLVPGEVLAGIGLSEADRKMLQFIAAWDLGAPLGEADIAILIQEFSPHEIVEMQMIAGLVGGQARIAEALNIHH